MTRCSVLATTHLTPFVGHQRGVDAITVDAARQGRQPVGQHADLGFAARQLSLNRTFEAGDYRGPLLVDRSQAQTFAARGR